MAINFLNTVDFNRNSVNNIRIQNLGADPSAANSAIGQVYFNTGLDTLKQYVSDTGAGNPGWVEVGATSGVESFTNSSGTYVAFGTNNTAAIGDVTVGTVDLTAVDGTSTAADRFLTKANKWATIPFGDITEVQPGTYINITNQTGPIPIVNHDLTTRTDTTSTAAPAYGATFTAIDTVTTNTTGHITALNTKTITIPASDDTRYTLGVIAGSVADPKSGKIVLTDNDGLAISTVTFKGTTGRVDVLGNPGTSEIIVDLATNVDIAGTLTVSGTAESTIAGNLNMSGKKLLSVGNGTAASDGVNLGQVEALVAGIGLFKGGYNATTGLTINLTPNGSLDGANNIALDQGDFFVVTTDGNAFYTTALEVGDMIFVNKVGGIAANSNPPIGDYTVVIQDANIAGSGATDTATEKGVAGFDSASFDVSVNGWVQLNSQRNPYGAVQSLNDTSPVSRAVSGGLTTFTINLADATLFGPGALAKNVTAEVTQDSAPFQTVYADVTRSGTASMSVVFSGTVAIDLYRVLLTHV